jgi:hypothetical protein
MAQPGLLDSSKYCFLSLLGLTKIFGPQECEVLNFIRYNVHILMNIESLSGSVMSQIQDELETLLLSVKGWHDAGIRVKIQNQGYDSDRSRRWFKIILHVDKHGNDVVSELRATVKGVFNDQVMLEVRSGWSPHLTEAHGDQRAGWRLDPIVIEASARALFPLLEHNLNREKIVKDVMER